MTNWSWSLQQGLDPQNEAKSLFSIDFYSVFNDGPGTISVQNPIQIQRHNRKYCKKQAKSNLSGPRLDAMTNCSWSLQQGLDPQNEAKSLFSIDFYSVLRAGHESHFWRKSCHQKPPVAKPLIFTAFRVRLLKKPGRNDQLQLVIADRGFKTIGFYRSKWPTQVGHCSACCENIDFYSIQSASIIRARNSGHMQLPNAFGSCNALRFLRNQRK